LLELPAQSLILSQVTLLIYENSSINGFIVKTRSETRPVKGIEDTVVPETPSALRRGKLLPHSIACNHHAS